MNPDLLRNFLSKHQFGRRDTIWMAGAAGAVGVAAIAGVGLDSATAIGASRDAPPTDFDDTPFDYSDPANLGDWAPSRYGRDDRRGAFNEVTPEKTAAALAVLGSRPEVRTYNLGELPRAMEPADSVTSTWVRS